MLTPGEGWALRKTVAKVRSLAVWAVVDFSVLASLQESIKGVLLTISLLTWSTNFSYRVRSMHPNADSQCRLCNSRLPVYWESDGPSRD